MKIIKHLYLIPLYLIPFISSAQESPQVAPSGEELLSLDINPLLREKQKSHFLLKSNDSLIYLIDTLQLPFADDFSTNRTTRGGSVATMVVKKFFTVDGNYMDTLHGVKFPTYMYFYNAATQQYDSSSTARTVVFYGNNNPASPGYALPTDTETVWKNSTYRFNEFSVDTLFHFPDTLWVNFRDTIYRVSDNGFLWLDSAAFINRGFAVNPPTIGVATFDGLAANGEAYDFSLPSSYGPADFLTSKPIDLSNLPADSSVILSFYYQWQGLGDFPDTEDSLALEFYSPADGLWHWAWSRAGITTAQSYQAPVFNLVKIPITDSVYLMKGFQFRFRNYATLSGMLDIWNIDYVYLDKNRNFNVPAVNDLAFVTVGNSFINSYTSMPMKAFKGNAAQYMVPTFTAKLANLSNAPVSADSNHFFVYDEFETVKYKESVNNTQSLAPFSQVSFNHSVFSAPNNFQFLPSNEEHTVFKIKFIAQTTSPDINHYNDTVVHLQIFDSYYAYDDGTAEGIYSLGMGSKPEVSLACKFNSVLPDSLRGVYLYFPYMRDNVSELLFSLQVWNDNNGFPGTVIHQSNSADNPMYSGNRDAFVRYEIDPPVPVNGTFYVGWKQTAGQTNSGKIHLGFDRNNNNQVKIFHTLAQDNSWNTSSLSGSLMMRPDFGSGEPPAGTVNTGDNKQILHVYPNPAKNILFIENPSDDNFQVLFFNTLGMEIYHATASGMFNEIDLSSLPSGVYFLQIVSAQTGSIITRKLVIARS